MSYASPHGQLHHRLPHGGQRVDGGILRRVVPALGAQVDEEPVVAVDAGWPSVSPTMGTMPRPSLPVLSASNCSSHAPKGASGGEMANVALFCPLAASVASAAPSVIPGFCVAGTLGAQACSIVSARSSSVRRSIPRIAAGTSPK